MGVFTSGKVSLYIPSTQVGSTSGLGGVVVSVLALESPTDPSNPTPPSKPRAAIEHHASVTGAMVIVATGEEENK